MKRTIEIQLVTACNCRRRDSIEVESLNDVPVFLYTVLNVTPVLRTGAVDTTQLEDITPRRFFKLIRLDMLPSGAFKATYHEQLEIPRQRCQASERLAKRWAQKKAKAKKADRP